MWDLPGYFQFLRDTPAKVAEELIRRDMAAPEANVEIER